MKIIIFVIVYMAMAVGGSATNAVELGYKPAPRNIQEIIEGLRKEGLDANCKARLPAVFLLLRGEMNAEGHEINTLGQTIRIKVDDYLCSNGKESPLVDTIIIVEEDAYWSISVYMRANGDVNWSKGDKGFIIGQIFKPIFIYLSKSDLAVIPPPEKAISVSPMIVN